MNTTSVFISYVYIGISAIALLFFIYFKILIVKTTPSNKSRASIIGEMKNPDCWRDRNNKMSYLSLFWCIISAGIFIYLKYFNPIGIISIGYVFIYLSIIIASSFYFSSGSQNKAK